MPMDNTSTTVRDVAESDLSTVAQLHVQAFPDSVLGELGVEAVRRNYLWQLTGPHDLVALVAVEDDVVLGFLFGGLFRGSTIGFVKKEKWFLARRLVCNPSIVFRSVGRSRLGLAAKLLTRRSQPSQSEEPGAVPDRSFGVLAIAVDPQTQGKGVGQALMNEARSRAISHGYLGMHLTVHPENTSALGFYRSLGWTELMEPDGSWVGRMELSLK